MRLTTIRTPGGTRAARVEGDRIFILDAPDLVSLLSRPDWRRLAEAQGETREWSEIDFGPAVRPTRVVCVGLNYRSHIAEMGRELPGYPTLFAKYPDALTGPYDDVVVPAVSEQVDWEAELGVVIGVPARRLSEAEAVDAIAGYTVVNDVSMRDWQWRTEEWLQGKNFEASTPVGPVVVTPDEIDHAHDLALTCEVDGQLMQSARTSDLLFPPAALVSYISTFLTLQPGDLIATGTPAGVGAGRRPQVFIKPGQVVKTSIEAIGACENTFVEDKP